MGSIEARPGSHIVGFREGMRPSGESRDQRGPRRRRGGSILVCGGARVCLLLRIGLRGHPASGRPSVEGSHRWGVKGCKRSLRGLAGVGECFRRGRSTGGYAHVSAMFRQCFRRGWFPVDTHPPRRIPCGAPRGVTPWYPCRRKHVRPPGAASETRAHAGQRVGGADDVFLYVFKERVLLL